MIHLHTRSCWSLLESSLKIEQIIDASQQAGQSYAVLTDSNTMYGTMAFFHACKKAGLKPIVGLEVHILQPYDLHLLLLAKNNAGLQDLYRLSSLIMTRDVHTLTLEELLPYTRNCVVINGGQDEMLLTITERGHLEDLAQIFEHLDHVFDDFYLSMAMFDSQRHHQSGIVQKSVALQLGVSTVALSRVDYLKEKDVKTVQMLQAIEKQTHLRDPSLEVLYGRWWRSEQEMEELYEKEDLDRTEEIAKKIQLDLDALKTTGLPDFENKLHLPSEQYLTRLCQAGLHARMQGHIPPDYQKRLDHELSIINGMGFADYFLIVWDFIREARAHQILVGPGRGSAAGSLAAWSIGITHVDPIENDLLFERFLNPERISMPDIDTDIPDDRRQDVIDYVAKRYGPLHVAHIVTFSTFKPKMALRDAGRVLNVFSHDITQLTQLIGSQLNVTLQQVYDTNPAFARLVRSKPLLTQLFETAKEIEGLPRHTSLHAGGIVFSKADITDAAPLVSCGGELPAVQFTMEHLEELGLIKFDFLGLKNLSVIDAINRLIERTTGQALDLFKLPLNDPAVFRLLCSGQTLGVFQLESSGIRSLILQFQPRKFEDIAAILALYRPGPMQNIGLYLDARRAGKKNVSLHPMLDPILKETGGIFLYQEQIMLAAQRMGGFSLAQADSLRKAMSKKNHAVMESYKNQFIEGAAAKRVSKEQAAHIFEVMERFADYGFNKSHSYAYGLVVYWMAYMKANYPLQFYACTLQSVLSDRAKTAQYLQEIRLRHIPVFGLSVNRSGKTYQMEGNGLRLPLSLIKTWGSQISAKVEAERAARGPFREIFETIARLLGAGLNKQMISALIDAGALDEFGFSRKSLQASLDRLIQYGLLIKVEQDEFLLNFEIATPPEIEAMEENAMERSDLEYTVLGLYVSEHPAFSFRRNFRDALPISQALNQSGLMTIAGRLAGIHTHKTKNNQMMAFITLEDETGHMDAAIMPELYARFQLQLQTGILLAVTGKKNRKESILANVLHFAPDQRKKNPENPGTVH